MYFTTYSSSADSMDLACLGPLVHAVSTCFSNDMMKSIVASQNIFLSSPGVYTGTTKTELSVKLFRGTYA